MGHATGTLLNPFPGLRPFEPEEDYLFFGREKEIDELLRRLRTTRFLSVVGTSGTGKSSLVRSGLIPNLHGGFMATAGSSWRTLLFRPGEDPIANLAEALDAPDILGTKGELASTNRVLLEATLRRGALGLVNAVRQARVPSNDNLLIVVDQFEELFRFRRDDQTKSWKDETVAFVKLLLEARQQNELPIYVVLTIRSDFIGDCLEYPGLPEAINAGQYLVPRMTRDEVRSAITGPVAVAGGEIAPRLVQRLLNELGSTQDQLPVLQHALMRTWDHWEGHHQPGEPIDFVDYEAIGTQRDALSLHAEEAFQDTGDEHNQRITQRLFRALTDTFSDPRGVRRPTSIRELAAICETPEPDIIRIVEIFRRPGRSFLMPPPTSSLESDSIVDLSHESLMRGWTRLVEWTGEEKAAADIYLRLSRAAAWFEEGTAGLWRNPELQVGLRWRQQAQPTVAWARRYDPNFAQAMAFLDRSEAERKRFEAGREEERKRKLRFAWAVACVLGIFLIVTVYEFYRAQRERNRAEANLQLAKTAVDESLSSAGRQQAREAADIPEVEEFRRELLEKAKNFYDGYLNKLAPNNEEFRRETALSHSRLGDIDRLLEKRSDAVKEYQAAITQFESLAKQYPDRPEYRQARGYAYNWLGETLRVWLEENTTTPPYTHANAAAAYDEALRLQQQLVAEVPANLHYQQELARTYYNRGILRYDTKKLKEGESDFREAIRLLETVTSKNTLLSIEGKMPGPTQELARVYNNLALLLSRETRPGEAFEFYRHAIDIHEGLIKQDPSNREYKLELAQFYNNMAILLFYQNRIPEAQQQNHQALDLIEELVSPVGSLRIARAKTHELFNRLRTSRTSTHPEFHVMYAALANAYVQLAEEGIKSGSLEVTRESLESLGDVLSNLSQSDRQRLIETSHRLQKELSDKGNQRP